MARARLLKPGFFANEKLTEVNAFGRLLFAGLWTLADREGRLHDRAKWIKGALFPYENVPVERLLNNLEQLGFILRYDADGERFIQIINFKKHQHVHVKEGPSTIPAPGQHRASPGISQTDPSEAEADTEADTEAEAEGANPVFQPKTDPPVADEPESTVGFAGEYVRHYRTRTGRDHPGASTVAACLEIERLYGFKACFQAAEDTAWEKGPNYLKPILEDRQHGSKRIQTPRSAAGSQTGQSAGQRMAARLNAR